MERGITAAELLRTSRRTAIRRIIESHIQVVDSAIRSKHELGENSVEIELPAKLDVHGFNEEDARIFFYSELIASYKRRGFDDITIDFQPRKVVFTVRWVNGLTDQERDNRKNEIARHQLRRGGR